MIREQVFHTQGLKGKGVGGLESSADQRAGVAQHAGNTELWQVQHCRAAVSRMKTLLYLLCSQNNIVNPKLSMLTHHQFGDAAASSCEQHNQYAFIPPSLPPSFPPSFPPFLPSLLPSLPLSLLPSIICSFIICQTGIWP